MITLLSIPYRILTSVLLKTLIPCFTIFQFPTGFSQPQQQQQQQQQFIINFQFPTGFSLADSKIKQSTKAVILSIPYRILTELNKAYNNVYELYLSIPYRILT